MDPNQITGTSVAFPESYPDVPDYSFADRLNGWADTALDAFDWLGETYDNWGAPVSSAAGDSVSLVTSPAQVHTNAASQHASAMADQYGLPASLVEKYTPHPLFPTPSPVTVAISRIGGFLDGVTGLFSTASAFHRDREIGDTTYRGTLQTAASNVGRISVSTGAGLFVGAVAAAATGTVAVPLVLGGGAAYLAGSAYGAVTDWIRNWK